MLRLALSWRQPRPASFGEGLAYMAGLAVVIGVPGWLVYGMGAGTAVYFVALLSLWAAFSFGWAAWLSFGRRRADQSEA